MKIPNIVSGLIVMIISVAFFIDSLTFPTLNDEDVGAAVLPQIYCIILFFLSLVLLIKTIRGKGVEDAPDSSQNLKIVFFSMGVVVIYLIIIPLVGFYLSTLLFGFSFLWFLKVRHPLTLILVPIGIALFVFSTFQKLLLVPLPEGIFF